MEKFDFLFKIRNIVNQYDEVKKETSDDYNLFSLLNRETDEVLTHSAIITDLLNPQGKHNLGNNPLKLFLEIFGDINFDVEDVQCFKELPIGKINKDLTKGGRIDIYIKNSKNEVILIENKIFASEQKNQLLRYYNFSPQSTIVYLTLEGEESKEINLQFEYKKISYKKDIINWIEQCIFLAENRPKLKESLSQYNHLLKKLTNQTTNNIMAKEVSDIIINNFVASSEIYKNYESAYNELYKRLLEELKNSFLKSYSGYNIEITDYKKVKSLNLKHTLENHSINIRIKDKSIIAINILNLQPISTQQKENLISNGFKGFESKNSQPWKITSDFDIKQLASTESREDLKNIFNKLILETIAAIR